MLVPGIAGRAAAGLFALALTGSACAARARPAEPFAPAPLAATRAELERLFSSPPVNQAFWAAEVEVLATGERLFSLNGLKLLTPASTTKLVTLAVAADRLGWDFRYQTLLLAAGDVVDGVLVGDLVVRGSGDPSIGVRDEVPVRAFDAFTAALETHGIHAVTGRLVGDDSAFDDEGLADGWTWEDLGYGYAAPVGALQYHENAVSVTIEAGPIEGEPVTIEIAPDTSGLTVVNRMATGPPQAEIEISLRRLPGQQALYVSGTVPAGSEPIQRTASVDNPTLFFVRALRAALIKRGIDIRADAVDIDDITAAGAPVPVPPRLLGSYESPPLAELAKVMMKASQNVYAEALLKTLGARSGGGTRADGRVAVEDTLTAWGVPAVDRALHDGSGLSRYNLLTADVLMTVLRRMYFDPRHREPFLETLPTAGEDGTLRQRLEGTRAQSNVRAKTGSMTAVRAIAGYVTTRDGEMLAFAILANHFSVPTAAVLETTDAVLVRLAEFTRK